MGEVALSCDERHHGMAAADEGTKNNNNGCNVSAAASSSAAASPAGVDPSAVVRWDTFLPKMVLRVLLVEADDSTRQIIAALLRKCSYRVAAVSDGLKAWEILKGRPHNIDLILTEVELPAISGFALLTLIMEHEICKNIPVIMMSSQDSFSTVYKCMLRGAADFLVKPIRKNELRNLWQHVWRIQASSSGGGVGPQDESTAQHNTVEATAENNAISNNSCDMACIQKNREYLEKGSDAQSSCTKPELDSERADTECVQELSHSKWSKLHSVNMDAKKQESHAILNNKEQPSDLAADALREATGVDAQRISSVDDKNSGARWDFGRATGLGPENNYVKNDSVREVIDLIGAFDNYLKCANRNSGSNNVAAIKVDTLPQLDLSLRRHTSGSVNQETDERQQHRLNHSDVSAFSRYVNRSLQHQPSSSPTSCNQQRDHSSHLEMGQPGESESKSPRPQQRLLPAPGPVRGLRVGNLSNGYNPLTPQLFRTQSGLSAMQSSGSVNHPETAKANANVFYQMKHHQSGSPSHQYHHGLIMQNRSDIADQTKSHEENKLETVEDRGHVSSATDQSGNSSFCNGTVNHLQNLHCGESNNEVKLDAVVPYTTTAAAADCVNKSLRAHDGNSIKSMQREAALTKFRLKRKERCFEKKVRYESRKKLAEKRPRVKGQFVRQVVAESQPGNTLPAG